MLWCRYITTVSSSKWHVWFMPLYLADDCCLVSRHHLRTVQTTAEGTPFHEAWTRRSVTSDMRRLRKTLTYLVTKPILLSASVFICLCLSVCICDCVFVCLSVCLCLSVCMCVCMSVCVSVCRCLTTLTKPILHSPSVFICLCLCVSVCMCVCMSVCVSVCVDAWLPWQSPSSSRHLCHDTCHTQRKFATTLYVAFIHCFLSDAVVFNNSQLHRLYCVLFTCILSLMLIMQ